jgi:NitT/TauT family transport system substrate-binding protein
MSASYAAWWSRREFLAGLTLAGMAGGLGLLPKWVVAEPPPETTRLRLVRVRSLCWAPQYVAEELPGAEGFTDVAYVPSGRESLAELFATGQADLSMEFVGPNLLRLDQGEALVFLAGVHVGCFELVATEHIRRVRDLNGRTAGIAACNGPQHVFVASILAHVGLDPRQDITWVVTPPVESILLLAEGNIDAYLGFPPVPQELRAQRIGHVLVNSATDRPWSQYFCCLVASSREFVQKHPVATKRALRAILKAADVCALQPERAARLLVDKGYTERYDLALQVMRELPYGQWRAYDPEDTLRFYALRLHEAGMIKSSPQKLIAEGTDWRFLNELKRELKG